MKRALIWLAGGAASALVQATCAAAQTTAASDSKSVDEVIVTGTRAAGHTALTSSAPINVVSEAAIATAGYPDLASVLEVADPSLNFPRAQTTPTSANTRPITLRGLSPDEVLVLVDGKRWHDSAVINTNFAVGRGAAPADLSSIPDAAIERVEILKDGASAQYGSDAIAGVVNIILKDNSSGGEVTAQTGQTERGDGANGEVAFNQGFVLGDGGHLTLSGDVLDMEETDRAFIDQRYDRYTYRIGDPDDLELNLAATAAYPLQSISSELYGNLIVARKDSSNAPTFITPGSTPLYPTGSLPLVNPIIYDLGETVGLRGRLAASLDYDLSNTFGYTDADFHVFDSANLSLGAASPTSFYAGTETYWQDVTDLTFDRSLSGILSGGNLAFGGQFRAEHYAIAKGEAASYEGSGSDAFPGLNPFDPVDASRTAGAAFIDAELEPVDWITLGGAARYDRYSDFGGAPTGRASIRVETTPWLALRASYSTGFRAPSLQQEYYNSVTVVANGAGGALVNLGTFEPTDPIAKALGAKPLRAETSRDASAGFVLTPARNLSVTFDAFDIDIDNRIALSNTLSGATVTSILTGAGITNVQQVGFFTNALDTRTYGFDVAANYTGTLGDHADYVLNLGYEDSPTQLVRLQPNTVVPSLPLLSTHPILLLTEAQPVNKLTSAATLNLDQYSATLDVTRYGHYVDAPISAPQTFSGKTIVNLSASDHLTKAITMTAGVLNLGNVYPDQLKQLALVYGSFGNAFRYGEESPFGTDGRAYYVRLSVRF